MSRSLQDQFIDDDEEETCPLCVEEFDLQDKGFRPCPCGYQICQFCYHNVKNNMNGLCPACRRPYNDADIEWKQITPEETAAHKARQAHKQRKTLQALQKEKQKAEADNLSRKHLAGMRVVQKNLVYVTGLSPTSQEDQLLQTLRGDQYFGQYGNIIKIVVSKAKDPSHPHSVGVYVTYELKEDAAACIAAVDGSKNGDRTLRAQFGTTKYCSAYLRGETCTNRNCMFLHEPGEANESYSRADLSALNAGSSQQGSARPPPPQSQQPVASAAPPMMRQGSADQHASSPASDRPALPSTASWATKLPQSSRAESRSTSGTLESPAPVVSTPAAIQSELAVEQEPPLSQEASEDSVPDPPPATTYSPQARKAHISPLDALLKNFKLEDFKLVWSTKCLTETEQNMIKNFPPLFDENGGAKRRLRRQREEESRRMEQEAQALQQPPPTESDDNPEMGGSLQLGGEPEERRGAAQMQSAIHPPGQDGSVDQRFQYGGVATSSPGTSDRGLTPQQHQQMLLQTLKPNAATTFMISPTSQATSNTSFPQQSMNPPLGHQRNVSRYSFANDSASASAAVKPVANPKFMNQQATMMPLTGSNHFGSQHQQPHGQFYTSNVQGPPPGLKTTGTPPVSGNLTFGQGHGFATGVLQYGAGSSRNQQDTYYRDLLRGNEGMSGRVDPKRGGMIDVSDPGASHLLPSRVHQGASGFSGGAFAGQAVGAADENFPPLQPPTRQASLDESRHSTPPIPPGFEPHLSLESRRSTPSVPPGLSKPTALSDLEGTLSHPTSRPSSRVSLRRQTSQILPALSLRPGTPHRIATPSRFDFKEDADNDAAQETPTKPSRSTTSSDLRIATSAAQDEKPDASTSKGAYGKAKSPNDQSAEVASQQKEEALVKTSDEPSAAATTGAESGNARNYASASKQSKSSGEKPESQKRKHPGKLDITAAVSDSAALANMSSTAMDGTVSDKPQLDAFPALPSSVRHTESPMASPAIRTAPRTLRVVQTPRTETPSSTASSVPGISAAVAAHRLSSRQPSVGSIVHPGTPSSDHVSISDNISMTSTSQSRANSPPPPIRKVGSAPVRMKTKSQQKKDRQERAKALEDEKAKGNDASYALSEEPVVEAIQSRKKKAKKEKEVVRPKPKAATVANTTQATAIATAETTPTTSRPATPSVKATVTPDLPALPDMTTGLGKESKPTTPTRTTPPPPQVAQQSSVPSPPATPTLSPAQLIAEMKAKAPQIQKCIDTFFRVSNSKDFKTHHGNLSHKDLVSHWQPDLKYNLTKHEVDALLKGRVPAFHYGSEEGHIFNQAMITPTGANLRALTKELELRFLELERALREMPEYSHFRPSKPQNEMKLPAVDLEVLKRQHDNGGGRGPSIMEQMVQDGTTLKKGALLVDEASKYINEFVMPPVTPPLSVANNAARAAQQSAAGLQGSAVEQTVHSVEIAERQLKEAQRYAEEKESALRKAMKKNKKILGLA